MRFDGRAFAASVVLELVLLVLAVFGGPHGTLGAWPWVLQVPGIFVVYSIPGNEYFLWRVAAGALVQVAVWYALIAFVRHRRRRAKAA